jgi:predicted nucleic acid-binding protein
MVSLCFGWMKENRVTFYDAACLAAAVEVEAILITPDARFAERMRHTGSIRLLNDL